MFENLQGIRPQEYNGFVKSLPATGVFSTESLNRALTEQSASSGAAK
jgi:hypothetical protein